MPAALCLKADAAALARAAACLRGGGLVAFPTETVYGLGADASNAAACAAIFAVKQRPSFDPLIVHVTDAAAARALCATWPMAASHLSARCWPGPLTLVLPRRPEAVSDLVSSGLPTVAVRAPAHPVAQALLRATDRPLAAPSANPFNYISPTCAEHVAAQLGDAIPLILDGGPCVVGVESTIVDLSGAVPRLLRPGGLPAETLAALLAEIGLSLRLPDPAATGDLTHGVGEGQLLAPGQMASHYAPRTPLTLLPGPAPARPPHRGRVGLLAAQGAPAEHGYALVLSLGTADGLGAAATRLFAALRQLDAAGLDAIVAEPVPATGLGLAIMDRLRKASYRP